VQRMTSLVTFFYLLSVVRYVKARLSIESSEFKKQGAAALRRRVKIGILFAGSLLAAVLAMKTKEIAFTLPFAVLLYEGCFFRGPWRRRLLYLLPFLATLPIVPMSVLTAGQTVGPTVGQIAGRAAGGMIANVGEQLRASTHMSRLDYLFTQFRVIVTYLRLLVLPVNQNLDYDYPVYQTFFTPPVFLSFLLLASIFALAVYLIFATRFPPSTSRKVPNPALRLIAFGILWFFLTLSVESSLIPILDVIMEYRLYLPSIGAFIAFSTAFFLLSSKFSRPGIYLSVLAGMLIIVSLSVATHQRNNVWGSAVSLWGDVVRKSPQKPKPMNNLGGALNDSGRPWEAIPILKKAVEISYKYDMANYNLGRSYLLTGQSRAAIPLLQEAIRITPNLYGAYSDLGAALIKDRRYNEAIKFLEQDLGLVGDMPEVHFNLGVAYFSAGMPQKARRELVTLSKLDQGLATKLADFLGRHQNR
ncbi:MAG: tetratricopeptide repeat protein, partial [Deltaproteobacteria bacterium]